MERFKKVVEVCKELGVSRQTIYRWGKQGLINIEKSPSGAIWIEVSSYEKFKKYKNGDDNL